VSFLLSIHKKDIIIFSNDCLRSKGKGFYVMAAYPTQKVTGYPPLVTVVIIIMIIMMVCDYTSMLLMTTMKMVMMMMMMLMKILLNW